MEGEGQRRRDINQRGKIKNHKDGISGAGCVCQFFKINLLLLFPAIY